MSTAENKGKNRSSGVKITRREFIRLGEAAATGTLVSVIATACGTNTETVIGTIEVIAKEAEEESVTVGTPTPKVEALPTNTSQPEVTPTLPEPIFNPNAGGSYSPELLVKIASGEFGHKEEQLADWVKYWGSEKVTNRPFLPEALAEGTQLNYVYFAPIDDPYLEKPENVIVALQAGGEYAGSVFYVPINTQTGQFRHDAPPVPVGEYELAAGDGPLQLSGGEEGLILVNKGGKFVRVDDQGVVKEVISKEGQWVEKPPENFVELEKQVKKEYVEKFGITDFEAHVAEFKLNEEGSNANIVVYNGFGEKRRYWNVNGRWLLLGGGELSIDKVPGAIDGDFVYVLYGARPDFPVQPDGGETVIMPFIAGVRYQGKWAHANNIWDMNFSKDERSIPPEIDNPKGLDDWVEKRTGEKVTVMAYIRFREDGDWNKDHINEELVYGQYKDADPVIKRFMNSLPEDVYFKKWTRDPKILGEPYGGGHPEPGEWPSLSYVYGLLVDSGVDYGLFVDRLFNSRDD